MSLYFVVKSQTFGAVLCPVCSVCVLLCFKAGRSFFFYMFAFAVCSFFKMFSFGVSRPPVTSASPPTPTSHKKHRSTESSINVRNSSVIYLRLCVCLLCVFFFSQWKALSSAGNSCPPPTWSDALSVVPPVSAHK